MHFGYLHAPPELLVGLNKLMRDYLLELERHGALGDGALGAQGTTCVP